MILSPYSTRSVMPGLKVLFHWGTGSVFLESSPREKYPPARLLPQEDDCAIKSLYFVPGESSS